MERKQLEISGLSTPVIKILSDDAPLQAKLDAARGLAPLKPGDLVTVLYCLCLNREGKVGRTASQTLSSLPPKLILSSLDSPLSSEVIDLIVEKFGSDQDILSRVVLHNNTADETIEVLARSCPASVVELIGRNQVRYLRRPSIIKSVSENPLAPVPLVQSMIEFAERNGVNFGDLAGWIEVKPVEENDEPEAEPVVASVPDAGVASAGAESVVTASAGAESVVAASVGDTSAGDTSVGAARAKRGPPVIPEPPKMDDPDIPSGYIEDGKEFTDQEIKDFMQWMEGQEKERLQKFAVNCNQMAAQLLSRNKDSEIALRLLENKRITTPVWVKIAGERRSNDILIKKMSEKKDMTRVYNIRIKLAQHPRTPIPTAMGLVRGLRLNDLKAIAKNKSISPTILNTAKGLLKMYGIKDPEKKE